MRTLLFALAIASTMSACAPNYSEGSRVGVVTKLSYKGLIYKSWEGSINQGGTKTQHTDSGDTVVANAADFSVTDPAVVAKLQEAYKSGKRVELKYSQWAIPPMTQNSSYTVVDIVFLD